MQRKENLFILLEVRDRSQGPHHVRRVIADQFRQKGLDREIRRVRKVDRERLTAQRRVLL